MADLSRAAELLAGAVAASPGSRWAWARWDGNYVYLEDAPDVPLVADNAAGQLAVNGRVFCLVEGKRVTILGPVHLRSMNTAGGSGGQRGYWWRSEDGLQICWVHTNTVRAESVSYGSLWQSRWEWTYGMPFIDRPAVSCSLWQWTTGASWGTVSGWPGLSSVLLRGIDVFPRTVADELNIAAIAIGRWRT